jgi:hypothetical protein
MWIDVWRDSEGVRMALEEIFEQDFARARLKREMEQADDETVARMELRLPGRTLARGYYRFADYLLRLDAQRRAGISFQLADLAAFEVDGLLALDLARGCFEGRHPVCSACGVRQQNRFSVECHACGTKCHLRKA